MLLTFTPTLTPQPLPPDFQPSPLHPLHKLYLDFRISLSRTLLRFFAFLQRLFGAERWEGVASSNPGFRIARVSKRYYLKWGVRDVEARAMCFVRERTSVPVPRVYGFWSTLSVKNKSSTSSSTVSLNHDGGSGAGGEEGGTGDTTKKRKKNNGSSGVSELNYMLIEALPGSPVGEVWTDMNETARRRFEGELGGYLRELRALEQDHAASIRIQIRESDAITVATGGIAKQSSSISLSSHHDRDKNIRPEEQEVDVEENHSTRQQQQRYIGALHSQPLTDHRIATIPYGPFETVESWLNCEYLLGYVARARPREVYDTLHSQLTRRKDVSVVFTHSDLTPRNVLVDRHTGKITGIVDWDSAGWCVDWWEGVKGVYGWNDRTFARRRDDTGKGKQRNVRDEGLMETWKGLLTQVVGDFETELKADGEMRDIYGFPY
ncbi:hypothetical protein TWF694_003706 [Orbilia ellipsospora]|uniref:Aminoglycoside phosphotransferase domain-containing protein n=1 Tax=Orbilia ellipsospora TaxID=2528407 RepID=A0AAV9X501_9PEZI